MEGLGFIKAIAALVFVLGLIWGFSLLLKRFGPGFIASPTRPNERRLKILEVLPIDARRRLVLIRRDEQEHLLLLGHEQDVVVEASIKPASKKMKEKI